MHDTSSVSKYHARLDGFSFLSCAAAVWWVAATNSRLRQYIRAHPGHHPVLLLVIHGHGPAFDYAHHSWREKWCHSQAGIINYGQSRNSNRSIHRHQYIEMNRCVVKIEALFEAQLLRCFPGPEVEPRAFKRVRLPHIVTGTVLWNILECVWTLSSSCSSSDGSAAPRRYLQLRKRCQIVDVANSYYDLWGRVMDHKW